MSTSGLLRFPVERKRSESSRGRGGRDFTSLRLLHELNPLASGGTEKLGSLPVRLIHFFRSDSETESIKRKMENRKIVKRKKRK